MKLNLGCRNNLLKGYINIDLDDINIDLDDSMLTKDQERAEFIRMDAMKLDLHFPVGSVDKIIANHFFEHLSHNDITILLYKIWSILKPGGVLQITVPDFPALIAHYRAEQRDGNFSNIDILHSRLFGIEEESFHKTVWYAEIGKFYLTREGFFSIQEIRPSDDLEMTFIARKI